MRRQYDPANVLVQTIRWRTLGSERVATVGARLACRLFGDVTDIQQGREIERAGFSANPVQQLGGHQRFRAIRLRAVGEGAEIGFEGHWPAMSGDRSLANEVRTIHQGAERG